MTNITVVIPTYNEAENLPTMAEALFALSLPGLHLIIVDDASPDGTGQIADRLAAEHPGRMEVIHREGKRGLGSAYITGFKRALADGAEYIVQMDADFSHSPHYIPEMVAQCADYDVVVGSRYVKGGKLDERWSWWRYALSWWGNAIYTRLILRLHSKDSTAGFKCWRRNTLLGIGLDRIHSNGYIFQVEMAYISERLGYRTLEIPIYFEDRRIGQSKMDNRIKIEAALRTWQIAWRHRRLTPRDRATLPTQQSEA